jgi:predicted nuclease of predicted toxin-antitoxin system
MKILIDMNLSPDWVSVFSGEDIESLHWSTVGDPRALDSEIVEYARANEYIIFTHDLDFGTILALTQSSGPSVIQVRAQDILPLNLAKTVLSILQEHRSSLEKGALIVVDETRARVRILPIQRD